MKTSPLDNDSIAKLNDFYSECIASIDLFYLALHQPSCVLQLQNNLLECILRVHDFGAWVQALISMGAKDQVKSVLEDIFSCLSCHSLNDSSADVIIRATKGRKAVFRAEVVTRMFAANLVAIRTYVYLSRIDASLTSEYWSFTLNSMNSKDINNRAIAAITILDSVLKFSGRLTLLSQWNTVIDTFCNVLLDFDSCLQEIKKLYKERFDANSNLKSIEIEFGNSIASFAGTHKEEELDFPLQHYLNENTCLKKISERMSSAKYILKAIEDEIKALSDRLKVYFACARTICMTFYSIFAEVFERLGSTTHNLNDWTVYEAVIVKGSSAFKSAQKIDEYDLAMSALLSMPWTPLVHIASLEQTWLNYCKIRPCAFAFAEIPVVHLFGAAACLISSEFQHKWLPSAIEIVRDLAHGSCQRPKVDPIESAFDTKDVAESHDIMSSESNPLVSRAVRANVFFASSVLYYSLESHSSLSAVRIRLSSPPCHHDQPHLGAEETPLQEVNLCTALLLSLRKCKSFSGANAQENIKLDEEPIHVLVPEGSASYSFILDGGSIDVNNIRDICSR